MLGDLKDEYGEMFANHPNWYIQELMAFGTKMYQLVFSDVNTRKIVRWDKTMKGISVKGNVDWLSMKSLHLYRNPVIDFCCILQYGSKKLYRDLNEVRSMMNVLAHRRKKGGKDMILNNQLNVSILFN